MGGNSVKIAFTPSEKGLLYTEKKFSPLEQLFPFLGDCFSEGAWCTGRQTGSHRKCFPRKSGSKCIQPCLFLGVGEIDWLLSPVTIFFLIIVFDNKTKIIL